MSGNTLDQQAELMTSLLPLIMRHLFRLDADDPTTELPIAQLRVCSTLQGGAKTMSVLSRELGTTLSAMTQITDRLERAHLVERITDGEDRRVKLLKLTHRAEELLQTRQTRRNRHAKVVLERLAATDREITIVALRNLLNAAIIDEGAQSGESLLTDTTE